MANTNGTLYGNQIATPPVFADAYEAGGRVRSVVDTFEIVAADFDADGDTLKLYRLPAEARIQAIKVANDDLDSATNMAINIGVYDVDGNVKDEDAYASAVTQFQAAAGFTDLAFEARAIENVNSQLWADAGDTEASHDPEYDIVITLNAAAATAQAGTVSFIIEYVID